MKFNNGNNIETKEVTDLIQGEKFVICYVYYYIIAYIKSRCMDCMINKQKKT